MGSDKYPISGNFLKGRLRHAISDREQDILESLFATVEHPEHEQELMSRGSMYEHSTILVEGFAIREVKKNGVNQIVCFHVPGDFIDLHAFALKRLDHNIVTLGDSKVAYVPHARLREVVAEEPHLTRILWFSTLLDAALHREWIVSLGELRASGRVAHFFAEVWHRLDMVGLARPDGFDTPLTQLHLANICGATPIHINRVLRDLREGNIADFRRGKVSFTDRAQLEKAGSFDPDYLYGPGGLAIGNALDQQD